MNKRLIWFSELFLWSVIILAVILGFTYASATAYEKNHSYYMFFNDVDGLSQGSPVRMMGFQIGYVRDVKVFDDNIFVSFLVTERNVYTFRQARLRWLNFTVWAVQNHWK